MPEPQVVLITGTRKGIGRHLAEHFADQGMLVEGCSRQPLDWEHPNYTHHLADVTDEKAVRAMLASIQQRHGRLDILINNAGIASMNHALLTPTSTVQRILDTNLTGTFVVCRESAKLMSRRRYGRIVTIGSVAGPLKVAGEAIYAASKDAVTTLMRVLSRELAEYGITCNVVAPTPLDTDLLRGVPQDKIDNILEMLTIKRFSTNEDVAHVVDFFVAPAASNITGQIICLGGV